MIDKDTQLKQAQVDTDAVESELTSLTDYFQSYCKRVKVLVKLIEELGYADLASERLKALDKVDLSEETL